MVASLWNTRAAPPATTAGEGDADPDWRCEACGNVNPPSTPVCLSCDNTKPEARPVPPVDEIVRDLWVHARSFGLIGSDPHRQVYERAEIERALRAALSARTAGEKAVTVEPLPATDVTVESRYPITGMEIRFRRGMLGSDPLTDWLQASAVRALVAQRGVR